MVVVVVGGGWCLGGWGGGGKKRKRKRCRQVFLAYVRLTQSRIVHHGVRFPT